MHLARLAPGRAGRQVRASGGAQGKFSVLLCQSVEGLAELAGKLEGEVTGENYTVVPSKSDQRDSVKEGWHESAPNLDIGAKLVVGTSDHRDAVKVTWQKQRAEPSL